MSLRERWRHRHEPLIADPEAPLMEARDVRVSLGGTDILLGADLALHPGELVAIVGPNGAGKSTFARVFGGLLRRGSGSLRWSGREIDSLSGRQLALLRAFVPQRAAVPAGVTVYDAVSLGRSLHLKPMQTLTQGDKDAVEWSMDRARVSRFRDRELTTLSGGEMQRVQIAVGLAQGSPVLIADEPTAQLDLGATAAVATLLRRLVDDGIGVILIVHDLALAAAVADRVVVMSEGRTVASGRPEAVLTRDLIAEVWGVDAALVRHAGRSALHVEWLTEA